MYHTLKFSVLKCFILNTKDKLDKFDPKSDEGHLCRVLNTEQGLSSTQ